MKRRKILKIFAFLLCAIYLILAVLVMVKMFPYYKNIDYNPTDWYAKNWGVLTPYLNYVYFIIYCICTLIIAWLDLGLIKDESGGTLLSVIWQIIMFSILLIMYEGTFSQYVGIIFSLTRFGSFPLVLALSMLGSHMDIFKWILFVIIFILTLVITVLLECLVCALIQKNIGCLFIAVDEKPTKTKNERRLKDDLSDAADMYIDMKNAENLQKTAEEVEKIRYEMSRRK